MHQILELLDFNNETFSLNQLIDIGSQSNEFKHTSIDRQSTTAADVTFSAPREFSLKNVDPGYVHLKVYEIVQSQDFEFKFSKSVNLFWNTLFYTLGSAFSTTGLIILVVVDMCYSSLELDTMPVLSSHLYTSMLLRFVDLAVNFWDTYYEVIFAYQLT